MTTNTTLLDLATIQQAVEEFHTKYGQLCSISGDGVHVLDTFFVTLFQNKREIVGRRDLEHIKTPFEYYTHIFGTKFYCISNNPDLFPIYPVEKLAEELLYKWYNKDEQDEQHLYKVIYREGSYVLAHWSNLKDSDESIYTYAQLKNDESVTLEQAILDHMESVH